MSYLKNNKVLLIIIGALLVVNVGLLYYGAKDRDHRKTMQPGMSDKERMEMTKNKLKESVGFTEAQLNQYMDLRTKHFESLRPKFDDLRTAKDSFFSLVYRTDISDSTISDYANNIGEKQKAIDVSMLNYFRSLRALSTPDQQPKMDSFLQNMTKRMSGNSRRGAGRDKDKKSK